MKAVPEMDWPPGEVQERVHGVPQARRRKVIVLVRFFTKTLTRGYRKSETVSDEVCHQTWGDEGRQQGRPQR